MTNGLKNIKLGLLGIVSAAIPMLFILQADKIESQNEDFLKQKTKVDSLVAVNFHKDKLLDFYKSELAKKNPNDSGRPMISFNPTISIPERNNVGINSSIDAIGLSIDKLRNTLLVLGLNDLRNERQDATDSILNQMLKCFESDTVSFSKLNKQLLSINMLLKDSTIKVKRIR